MKLFSAFLAVLLFTVSAADAAMNLRQRSDGTAEWVDSKGNTHRVAAYYLHVRITDLSTASSTPIAFPGTDGRIIRADISRTAKTTGTAAIQIHIGTTASAPVSAQTATTGAAPFNVTAGNQGASASATYTSSNDVQQGETIYIETDGGSTGTSVGNVILTIVPR